MRKIRNKTLKNKAVAIILMYAGYLSTLIDGDGTGFVLTLMIGLLLFFAREEVVYWR